MKVLLDECTPRALSRHLPQHSVSTVPEMGWSGVKNGELLRRVEAQRFEVFVTSDQSLRHQQQLAARPFGVVVLPSNQVPVVVAMAPEVDAAISRIGPGDVVVLDLPRAQLPD